MGRQDADPAPPRERPGRRGRRAPAGVDVARANTNTVVIGPVVRVVFAEGPFHPDANAFHTIEGTIPFTYSSPGAQSSSGNLNPDASVNLHATIGSVLRVFETDFTFVYRAPIDTPREQSLRQKLEAHGFLLDETGHGRNGSVMSFQAAHELIPSGDITENQTPSTIEQSYQTLTTRFPPQG